MVKEVKTQRKTPQNGVRLMVRVEYVGIIAVAFLVIGMMIGSKMSGASGKIVVDTAPQAQPGMTAAAMPSPEEIKHTVEQIGKINNYGALVNMGNKAMDEGITAVAVAAYEKALTMQPNDPNVITDLGAVYRDQMKDPKKAVELFQRAAKVDPKHVQSRYNLGLAAMDTSDFKTAKNAFSEVIKIAPDSEQAQEAKQRLEDLKKHGH
jgi:cytochrome c-type biogenesis protein CcmH/NrfG